MLLRAAHLFHYISSVFYLRFSALLRILLFDVKLANFFNLLTFLQNFFYNTMHSQATNLLSNGAIADRVSLLPWDRIELGVRSEISSKTNLFNSKLRL